MMVMSDYQLLSNTSSQAYPNHGRVCTEYFTNYFRHYNSRMMMMSDYQLLSNTSSQAYPHQGHICTE